MSEPSTGLDLELSRRELLLAIAATTASAAAPPNALAANSEKAAMEAGTLNVSFEVNGVRRTLELEPPTTLLNALREHLHLTGTKKGCDHGVAAAVANAIYNATGVRVREYPITLDKLLDRMPTLA